MVSESRTGRNRVMGSVDEVRKVIESIREIVGNHSDADIYTALKEANMSADEAVHKLIYQDPFHEVKRRKDRKKEDAVLVEPANGKKPLESITSEVKVRTQPEGNVQRGGYNRNVFPRNAAPRNAFPRNVSPRNAAPRNAFPRNVSPRKAAPRNAFPRNVSPSNAAPRNAFPRNVSSMNAAPRNAFPRNAAPRNAFPRNPVTGSKREFRVVRDNRSNSNVDEELKQISAQSSESNISKVVDSENKKGSTGGAEDFAEDCSAVADVRLRDTKIAPLHHPTRTELSDGKHTALGVTLPSTNSVLGVYSSSTDPVHVPSPVSRSSPVGAIKREVRGGGFGGKRSENAVKDPSAPAGSLSGSSIRKIGTPHAYRSPSPNSKIDQLSQTTVRESFLPSGVEKNRPLLNRQRGNRGTQNARTQQQVGGHTKGVSQNKEWKPKSIQKPVGHNPGVIGTPTKSQASHPADNSINLESEAVKLQDKLSHVHISESQNVIIADHIRVPKTDRCQLTFGSFVQEISSLRSPESTLPESCSSEEFRESDRSSPVTSPETLADGPGVKPIDILDDHVRISESDSRISVASEQQLPEEKEAHRSDSLDEYSEIQLLNRNGPPYTPLEFEQQQNPPELQKNSQAYGSYDFPYFSPAMDENLRGQGLPSQQEQASSTHMVNNAPSSTIPMLQQQQQQQQMQQMYPQVHVSHFPNLMPYRQFLSPVYVPQMPMPGGYSGNPAAYAHPSNGNSYVLMPGGGSHPGSNGVKFGIQQFKPVQTGGPTGFGTYNNGYQINSPNVVGNAMGLEDPSRRKYKDGNIYVPNPQAETPEIWMQNPRDLSSLQSPPYYNVAGQTPHGTYLPSHTAHPSFNAAAAAAQSSQMQFHGLFHPPQPGAMANPHHMGPGLGGNVGVGVVPSPSSQLGAYQQSQLGHTNWPANF